MNKKTQKKLRQLLLDFLKKEIVTKDCVLLDLPNYFNPGDQLIWEGEEELLGTLGKNITYRASCNFFDPKYVSNETILLHGGGNFGDIYPKHQKFREQIIRRFAGNKIIILPQTIHYSAVKEIKKTAIVFSRHSNLVVCARDRESYSVLKKYFKKNKLQLLPDSAFALQIKQQNKKTEKSLFLFREDKEKNTLIQKNSLYFIKNLDISDWKGSFDMKKILIMQIMTRTLNKIVLNLPTIQKNKRAHANGVINFNSKEKQMEHAKKLFSKYDLIITTRLHGHILACLMGIPNIVIDNSYGKNRNFYNTWIKGKFSNVYYANSVQDTQDILRSKITMYEKY